MSTLSIFRIEVEALQPSKWLAALIELGWLLQYWENIDYIFAPSGTDPVEVYFMRAQLPLGEANKQWFFQELLAKEAQNYIVGWGLTWQSLDENEIIMPIYYPESRIIDFDLNPFRKRVKTLSGRITNLSWYLERIVPALEQTGSPITSIEFRERY